MKENKSSRKIIIAVCAVVLAGALAVVGVFVVAPAVRFSMASNLAEQNPAEAFAAFERLGDYRDARVRMRELQQQVIASRSQPTMEFGGMNWLVLEERGGRALLLLEEPIGDRAYHEALIDITWEGSNIRTYLNGMFFNRFDEEYQARVVETDIVNSNNATFGTRGGNDTEDRVFLLSLAEAALYFDSATARVARMNNSNVFWWLRSPGMEPMIAATVRSDGELGNAGSGVNAPERTIRPAMWVRL